MEKMTSEVEGLDAITKWYTEGGFKRGQVIEDATFGDASLVQSVDTEWVVETAGNQGSIHSHSVIRVKHTGTLFFDRLGIKEFTKSNYNALAPLSIQMTALPNVQVRLLGNPDENAALKNYLLKELAPDAVSKAPVEEGSLER